MSKKEMYFAILAENAVTGKFRKIDDAIAAAEHKNADAKVVYVVEQDEDAFYSETSFAEAEAELKAERKKRATEKMLATKAAKKAEQEPENTPDSIPDPEPEEEPEPLPEPTPEPVEESTNELVGKAFINKKRTEIVKVIGYDINFYLPYEVRTISVVVDKCGGTTLQVKPYRHVGKVDTFDSYPEHQFDVLYGVVSTALDNIKF